MDIASHLETQLQCYLQDKFTVNRFSFKYQNKQLAETGEITIKFIEPLKCLEAEIETRALVEESNNWIIPLQHVQCSNTHWSVFLHRENVYRYIITELEEKGLKSTVNSTEQIYLSCDTDESGSDNWTMQDFRVLSVRNVVRNLLAFSNFGVLNETSAHGTVQQINIGRNRSIGSPVTLDVLCGPVITNGITAAEYIRKRANDMQLIAQHKYGIRVKDHQRFQMTIASLGRSAAIVDMLESKASSPIDMKNEKNQSSKGASFILYNYARISVLFKSFAEKQKNGYYPELPSVDQIDFSLLKEEDEWQLFWVYVVGFPEMLKQALGDGQFLRLSPHLVLCFTSGLVICLSKYYRRVRILTATTGKWAQWAQQMTMCSYQFHLTPPGLAGHRKQDGAGSSLRPNHVYPVYDPPMINPPTVERK